MANSIRPNDLAPPDCPPFLILTVGTGTAGRQSNIASGLRRTLELLKPQAFWMVSSSAEDSVAVADLVREGFPAFQPMGDGVNYAQIEDPDDLEQCRRTIRSVIQLVRTRMRPGQQLILNPTSGTKQMTAGATLAALDEGIGQIAFTVGERADGVVKTGAERIQTFDAAAYFRERDLVLAHEFHLRGAYGAAERVLRPHREALGRAYSTALCLDAWCSQDYASAAGAAARVGEDLRRHLATLARDSAEGRPTAAVLADLFGWAGRHLAFGHTEEAHRLVYKCLEFAARLRIEAHTGSQPPYSLEVLDQPGVPRRFLESMGAVAREGRVVPGLARSYKWLGYVGDEMGQAYQQDPRLRRAAEARNEHTHSIRPIEQREARQFFDLVHNFLALHLAIPEAFHLPEL